MKLTIIAVSASILLHVGFVVFSIYKKIDGSGYVSKEFVPLVTPVEFMDPEELEQNLAEEMKAENAEKVSNIDFNSEHKREASEDPYSSKTEQQIEEQVERELREFEANEFAKYKKDKTENVITDKSKTDEGINTENSSEKIKTSNSFAGSVTAEWYLSQRGSEKLFKPSYLCRGSGKVRVNIIVDREGVVREAVIDKKNSDYKESCIGDNALLYAKRCRFSVSTIAPVEQEGWITYTYIAQ